MKKVSVNKIMFIVIVGFFAVLIFLVPILINESYKGNSGYMTLWEAKDLLAYFGSVISAIGTIFIGIIAFKQSERANDIKKGFIIKRRITNYFCFFRFKTS